MPNEATPDYAKALYEYAVSIYRSQDNLYAICLFEKLQSLRDVFYTPFALANLAVLYKAIAREDLELDVFRRIVELPKDQQEILNPRWVSACYQRIGDFQGAEAALSRVLQLAPNDVKVLAARAEICLLAGRLIEAAKMGEIVRENPEPGFQIIGRMIRAFALSLMGHHDLAAKDLSWVGQFIIASGVPGSFAWDFRDLGRLVDRLGPNARAAGTIINVLLGRMPPQQFGQVWGELTAAATQPSRESSSA
jgi:tetratricopeptide (TPR) repeat protein